MTDALEPDSDEEGELSLDVALHDADVTSVSSDRMARQFRMEMDIGFLSRFAGLPEDTTWALIVEGVNDAIAKGYEFWPGGYNRKPGISREEDSAAIDEYHKKGRMVSLGWSEFEALFTSDSLWLKNAALEESETGITLTGGGHMHESDRYVSFEVAGERLRCLRSDGLEMAIDELLDLGAAYWDDWAKGGPDIG